MANDSTHVTLGASFRTPAHPEVLAALGRALYNFLSLEETVTAILYESGFQDISEARGLMAEDKENALKSLAKAYRRAGDSATADALDAGRASFRAVRKTVRNELLHAHPFTAGHADDGTYLPGLAYTVADGSSWKTIASAPQDLLELAAAVETAIDPLSTARSAVLAAGPLTTPEVS